MRYTGEVTISSLQSSSGMFTLFELDTVPYLAHVLGLELEVPSNRVLLETLVQSAMRKLASASTGVVLDPIWSLPAALASKPTGPGLVLRLDRPVLELDPEALPILIPEWGVEAVRHNYAVATATLQYHPHEKNALEKKQFVAELWDYCHHEGIAFFLKLFITQAGGVTPDEYFAAQLTAVQELRATVDLIGLQHPGDALSCATLTAELDVPWLVITDGYDYPTAKEVIRDGLENGARGALVGRVMWQELQNVKQPGMQADLAAIEKWLLTEGRDRMVEVNRIVQEDRQHAH